MSKSCRPRSPSPPPSLTSSTAYLPTMWPNSPSPGQSPTAPATCSNSSTFRSEVVQAQESLTAAELDVINSVFAHNVAKLSLARAVANGTGNLQQFLNFPI